MKKTSFVYTDTTFPTNEPEISKNYVYKNKDVKDFFTALVQAGDAVRWNAKLVLTYERHEDTTSVSIAIAMKKGSTVEELRGAESLLDYRMKMWEVA